MSLAGSTYSHNSRIKSVRVWIVLLIVVRGIREQQLLIYEQQYALIWYFMLTAAVVAFVRMVFGPFHRAVSGQDLSHHLTRSRFQGPTF